MFPRQPSRPAWGDGNVRGRSWVILACVVLGAIVPRSARAQSLLGAGTAESGGAEACGWVLVRQPSPPNDPEKTDDAQVLLVPPFGVDGAPRTPGVFRVVRALENWPDAVSAQENRLTVAVPGDRAPLGGLPVAPGPVEVLSLWVEYDGGRWMTGPEGALDSSPALPAGCRVYAMTATRAGLMAVVTSDAWARGASVRVLLLSMGAWTEVMRPGDGAVLELATSVRLVSTPEGAVLIAAGPTLEDAVAWAAVVTPGMRASSEEDDDPDAPNLSPSKLTPARVQWSPLPALVGPGRAKDLVAAGIGGQVIVGWVGEDGTTLQASGGGTNAGWRQLARVPSAEGDVVLVPLASEGRVAVVWHGSQDTAKGAKAPGLRFAEVSAATGRVLAQGEVELAGPATRSDYRAVMILLAWVSAVVALIVLRPREDRVLLMPDGLALAEPAQRMIAGTIDLVLCLVAAGFILGRGPLEVLTTSATGLLTSTEGQWLLAGTVLLGVATGTLSEWLTGRSIGKALCGCVVADLSRPVPAGDVFGRVRFGQSLMRNIVKWCVPPAGLFGVLSGAARHRGDEYAGAGVLSAVEDETEDE